MSTPDEVDLRVRMLRILAAFHRKRAADLDMAASAVFATHAMDRLVDVTTEAEGQEVAAHPDLAELNVQLNALYERPPAGGSSAGDTSQS
ncbi:hypothetical protein [Streptomyces xiamenensis]|uniref:hypothetical protein n=1 Tax=Streptomyces xiamenensis TaxID=408015 RepID=UPI0037D3E9EF